jgi:aspartyl-tRNA(Asn)/glutamyl-tRNA(Gln) amidotransferase subunit C
MDSEELSKLCKTARLRLADDEARVIGENVTKILEYFDSVSDEEAASLEPAYHPVEMKEKLREDNIVSFEEADLLIAQTKMYRFFIVGPKI